MARWTDLATWVGPTTARTAGAMASPPRGLVLHIASGYYEGTIAWQKRSTGSDRTSSHFIVARDGRCAQMVDTADGSWAQRAGNSTWLSVELEGFAPDDGLHASHPGWETATAAQLEVCARLLARAHRDAGVPLQLATSPYGRGLGHHSMGAESGIDWGHSACPGDAIKAQKGAILARAQQLAAGSTPTGDEDDMGGYAKLDLEPGATNIAVPGGSLSWKSPTYLAICNDTFDVAYGLRIYTTTGDGSWTPIDADGLLLCQSGHVYGFPLPEQTRCVSIVRAGVTGTTVHDPMVPWNPPPPPAGGTPLPEPVPYAGHLSVALER